MGIITKEEKNDTVRECNEASHIFYLGLDIIFYSINATPVNSIFSSVEYSVPMGMVDSDCSCYCTGYRYISNDCTKKIKTLIGRTAVCRPP